MNNFQRLEVLIGKENVNKIKKTKVLLVGLGGVGSFALESLIRNGIENITLVDFDTVDVTNLNRQLIALSNNIGEYKADVSQKRAEAINSKCKVTVINERLDENNINEIMANNYDYVVDAIDDLKAKKLLITYCLNNNIKIVSSMGTACKMDPQKLMITELKQTTYDPIAKLIRKHLKEQGINKPLIVVSSTEEKIVTKELGSNCLVPSVAGIYCASYIINDIIKKD